MPTVVSPDLYRTRFTEAMQRYFLMVPDIWTGFGNELSWIIINQPCWLEPALDSPVRNKRSAVLASHSGATLDNEPQPNSTDETILVGQW